jgi:hypothetical protein
MGQTITGYQQLADAVIDRQLEMATAMRQKLNRLAKAQALFWNSADRETQQAYLRTVDRMEAAK